MSVSRTSCLLALLLLLPLATWGVIETYSFSSAELEARYHSLSQELRCPKCQNQNIADSNAPLHVIFAWCCTSNWRRVPRTTRFWTSWWRAMVSLSVTGPAWIATPPCCGFARVIAAGGRTWSAVAFQRSASQSTGTSHRAGAGKA